jgi:hypothetical protein
VIDAAGFVVTEGPAGTRGYGTLISTGTILVDGKMLEIKNTYVLPQHSAYLKITTSIKNVSSGPVENVRLWVGTRDDWVGATDVPAKKKGNLIDGKFVPVTAANQPAAALQITSGDEGVFIYADSPQANTLIQACCSFGNVISQDPQTSPIHPAGDASYGFYVRMNDLAADASDAFTWYYGAGELDLLPEIIVDVAAANSGMRHIAYTTASFHTAVPQPGTGYWMVIPRNTAPPTAAQIKAGGAGPGPVAASGAGAITAHTGQSFDIGGLSAGTAYDFYFVAEGADGAFSAVVQVPFATLAYSVPVVSTAAPMAITKAGAVSGGLVAADGGTTVTARGVCWSATSMPTIAGSKTLDGTGTGAFNSTLTNLAPNTTYFIRSYATNAAGTAYGNLAAVKTSPAAPASLSRSADLVCAGAAVTLTANGAVGEVHWYAGGCDGTLVGTGSTIVVSPGQTTTYYARNYNGTFSDCAAVTVPVNNAPPGVAGKDITVWMAVTSIVLPSSLTLPSTCTFVAPLSSLCFSRYSLASFWPFSSNLIHLSLDVTPMPDSAHFSTQDAGCLAASDSSLALPSFMAHLLSIRMPWTPFSCSSAFNDAPENARPDTATAAIRNLRMDGSFPEIC